MTLLSFLLQCDGVTFWRRPDNSVCAFIQTMPQCTAAEFEKNLNELQPELAPRLHPVRQAPSAIRDLLLNHRVVVVSTSLTIDLQIKLGPEPEDEK